MSSCVHGSSEKIRVINSIQRRRIGYLKVIDSTSLKHGKVYDYAFYNYLGDPNYDLDNVRAILGGSFEYPYPRRDRIGRPPIKSS